MNLFLVIAFLFCVGSLIGWGIEVVFRRFFSGNNPERKWINPGFLAGPCLPLYGFSLCILYLLALCEPLLPITEPFWRKAALFCVMALCVTALEYAVGILSIKVMKVRLWDYSNCRGNIKGVICPLFTFFWALLSAIYYFLVHPHILDALAWLSNNLAFSFCIGFFYGVFVIDLAYSAQLIARIRRFAADNQVVVHLEELREHIRKSAEYRRERAHFFLSMYSPRATLGEHMKQYLEHLREMK